MTNSLHVIKITKTGKKEEEEEESSCLSDNLNVLAIATPHNDYPPYALTFSPLSLSHTRTHTHKHTLSLTHTHAHFLSLLLLTPKLLRVCTQREG